MANSTSVKAFRANGTIRVGRFVKLDPADNHSVLEADANERVIGISDMGGAEPPIPSATTDPPNAAVAGDDVLVHMLGSGCLLYAGSGGWTTNDELKSDADGKGVGVATTGTTIQEIGAVALEDATAGEYSRVQVVLSNRRPAIS